jgi:ChrR Cupin-like domain
MTTDLFLIRESVAEYALGILEAPEDFTVILQRDLANDLAKLIDLPAEIWASQVAVSHLAYGVNPVSLPTELKNKLLIRLDRVSAKPANLAELLQWPIADLKQVAKDLPNWEPFPFIAGSERVIWQVDQLHAQMAFFLRIPAVGQIPSHSHTSEESILILEGNLINDGIVYEVGSLYVTAANTTHQPFTSLGCLVLSITSEPSSDCPSPSIVLI